MAQPGSGGARGCWPSWWLPGQCNAASSPQGSDVEALASENEGLSDPVELGSEESVAFVPEEQQEEPVALQGESWRGWEQPLPRGVSWTWLMHREELQTLEPAVCPGQKASCREFI